MQIVDRMQPARTGDHFPIFDEVTGAEVIDRKLCLVLGRLFKLHPSFDDIVASIIERLYESEATSATMTAVGAEQLRSSSSRRIFIIFIAEDNFKLNDIVFRRLRAAVRRKLVRYHHLDPHHSDEVNSASFMTAQQMMRRYVRFYRYEGHYHSLLRHADVVLDTYPYGGE